MFFKFSELFIYLTETFSVVHEAVFLTHSQTHLNRSLPRQIFSPFKAKKKKKKPNKNFNCATVNAMYPGLCGGVPSMPRVAHHYPLPAHTG